MNFCTTINEYTVPENDGKVMTYKDLKKKIMQ